MTALCSLNSLTKTFIMAMVKMWIARDSEGLTAFAAQPTRYHLNPFAEDDFLWMAQDGDNPIPLDPNLYAEVTIDNSPKEVNIEIP